MVPRLSCSGDVLLCLVRVSKPMIICSVLTACEPVESESSGKRTKDKVILVVLGTHVTEDGNLIFEDSVDWGAKRIDIYIGRH